MTPAHSGVGTADRPSPGRVPPNAGSLGRKAEDRMVRSDTTDLAVRSICADAVEEHADFHLPPLEISAKHLDLLVVGELRRPERLGVASDA